MSKTNANWEPDLKNANKKQKQASYGIDANSDERFAELGRSAKKKTGFGKIIVLIIIGLILFDAFIMQGELFINILKNLLGK